MRNYTICVTKGYNHKTVLKIVYYWLPVFAFIILVCSYFDKYRYTLYVTVVGSTYGFILNKLKKRVIHIAFCNDRIIIDKNEIPISHIKEYHISVPLNDLIILRLKTSNKTQAIYIVKEKHEIIDHFFKDAHIPNRKKFNDYYLQYGHLILPFALLLICAVINQLYKYLLYAYEC